MSEIKPPIAAAIAEIRAAYRERQVDFEPDGSGGAFVRVDGIDIGPKYSPQLVWIGFQIVYTYPFADVYPHYFPHELKRVDGQPLGEAIHANQTFTRQSCSVPATMVSRKSNKRDPQTETAAVKLAKVIEWVRNR
jgi:hypothetical protein